MEQLICNSTKRSIVNDKESVQFPCPKCGKYNIVRSGLARRIAAKYECPVCGFTGPN